MVSPCHCTTTSPHSLDLPTVTTSLHQSMLPFHCIILSSFDFPTTLLHHYIILSLIDQHCITMLLHHHIIASFSYLTCLLPPCNCITVSFSPSFDFPTMSLYYCITASDINLTYRLSPCHCITMSFSPSFNSFDFSTATVLLHYSLFPSFHFPTVLPHHHISHSFDFPTATMPLYHHIIFFLV